MSHLASYVDTRRIELAARATEKKEFYVETKTSLEPKSTISAVIYLYTITRGSDPLNGFVSVAVF